MVRDPVRDAEVGVDALVDELERRISVEEAHLAQAPAVPQRDHAARLQRAYDELEAQVRATADASGQQAPRRPKPHQVARKVDAAVAAMEERVAAVAERCGKLEAAIAGWQARAEAAVRDGDDDAARYALRARAAAEDAARKLQAELQVCREAVEAWRAIALR